MRLLWQRGHLPGFEKRSLFVYTNPHFSHCAEFITRCRLFLFNVFLMCSRWSQMSFSGMRINCDRFFAEKVPSSRSAVIYFLIVSCRETGTVGSLFLLR